MTLRETIAGGLAGLVLLAAAGGADAKSYDPAFRIDNSAYDALLGEYVTGSGVRYAAWHANAEDRAALDTYVSQLEAASPTELTRYQRLAFWINAYNAVTLKLILDHYPVKSIKKIDNPWKEKRFTVQGTSYSLDEIENEVIRKQWKEPRIHFAINCGAVSCPPLRAQAYEGAVLDEQLEEQTVAFLGNPDFNDVDDRGRLQLSKIFGWYREDFDTASGSLAAYVRPYFDELKQLTPEQLKKVKVKTQGYDWDLNEAPAEP